MVLCLLVAAALAVRANTASTDPDLPSPIGLTECKAFKSPFTDESANGTTVQIVCKSDADIYVTPPGNNTAYVTHSTAQELTTAGIPNNLNWEMNQQMSGGANINNGNHVSGASMLWVDSFAVKCGNKEMVASAMTGVPVNFVFVSQPTDNPMDPLMLAFGAISNPSAIMPRTLGFVFFSQWDDEQNLIPTISTADWEACLDDGTAIFQVLGANHQSTADKYTFTDSSGSVVAPSETPITRDDVVAACTKEVAVGIEAEYDQLEQYMETATTENQLNSARATQNAMISRRPFQGCHQLVKNLYSEVWENVTLHESKACTELPGTNEFDADPCCSPIAAWSQCCAPRQVTKIARQCAHTDEVCVVNENELAQCDPAAQSIVRTLVKDVVAPSVLESHHPQFGCDKTASAKADPKMWRHLWMWTHNCQMRVLHGKTKTGQDNCADNTECWTGECEMVGMTGNQCKRVDGEGAVEPMFRCMMFENSGSDLGNYLLAVLDIDPSSVSSDSSGADAGFIEALAKFHTAVTEESCAGDGVDMGWCTNSLTKAQCETLASTEGDSETAVVWIDDPLSSVDTDGWCKMKNDWPPSVCNGVTEPCGWGHWSSKGDAIAQEACDRATKLIYGCVLDAPVAGLSTADKISTQAACTAPNQWVNYGDGTFHRLAKQRAWEKNENSGMWEAKVLDGNQVKCEAQKSCNWDPWGTNGGSTETSCLAKDGVPGTGADIGHEMFCGDCYNSAQCHERMSRGTCAVRPHSDQNTCLSESGHADWSDGNGALPDATWDSQPWNTRGQRVWNQCYRGDADHDTREECLPTTICENLPFSDDHIKLEWGGNVWGECAQPFCFRTDATDESACHGLNSGDQTVWNWRQEMANGNGLCMSYEWSGTYGTKSSCEAGGSDFKWWEGRIWIMGWLDTSASCTTGYCHDNTPNSEFKTSCGTSKMCNRQCSVPHSDYWQENNKNRMCYDTAIASQDACTAATHTWDNKADVCKLKEFTGDEAQCTSNANHEYKDCFSFTQSQLTTGCHLTNITKESDCWDIALSDYTVEWDWHQQKCYVRHFNQHDGTRFPTEAQCLQFPQHDPIATFGTTATDIAARKKMDSLRCWWDYHGKCPDQAQCEETGECTDWEFEQWVNVGGSYQHQNGVCVLSPEQHQADGAMGKRGDRMWCHHYSPGLASGGVHGCIDKTVTDKTTCVAKTSANGGTWSWKERATSAAQCLGHGGVCQDQKQFWKVYGGIDTDTSCSSCGNDRVWQNKTRWNGGVWQTPTMWQGSWKRRMWGTKFVWGTTLVKYKVEELADKAISTMFGEAFKEQIMCKLNPLVKPLATIGCSCASGTSDGCGAVAGNLQIPLSATTVFCNDLAATAPIKLSAGSIEYTANSQCPVQATNGMATEVVSKGTVAETASRRLSTSSHLRRLNVSVCSTHAVITNKLGSVCGQKMGTGLSSTVANVNLCVGVSVPAWEQCSEYTVMDFAIVHDNGTIGEPLGLPVTVDGQGRYCATTNQAGMHLPLKRMPDCSPAAAPLAPTTLAPTTMPPTTIAPTTTAAESTTLAPTTLAPTTMPPTTMAPTTTAAESTTLAATTLAPTTMPQTTLAATTLAPTTMPHTTMAPTTTAAESTTLAATTLAPTTMVPATMAPATTAAASTTLAPTTLAATTMAPTPTAPTTTATESTTPAPTTSALAPTSMAPTTMTHTTMVPTTTAAELMTLAPTTEDITTSSAATTATLVDAGSVVSQEIEFSSFPYTSTAAFSNAMQAAVVSAIDSATITPDAVAVSVKAVMVRATYAFDNSLTSSQIRQAIAEANSVSIESVTIGAGRRLTVGASVSVTQEVTAQIEVVAVPGEDLLAQAKVVQSSASNIAALAASLDGIVGSTLPPPAVVSAPVAKVHVQWTADIGGDSLVTDEINNAVGAGIGGSVVSSSFQAPVAGTSTSSTTHLPVTSTASLEPPVSGAVAAGGSAGLIAVLVCIYSC